MTDVQKMRTGMGFQMCGSNSQVATVQVTAWAMALPPGPATEPEAQAQIMKFQLLI